MAEREKKKDQCLVNVHLRSGASCSKLTMSLVNDLLKFQT